MSYKYAKFLSFSLSKNHKWFPSQGGFHKVLVSSTDALECFGKRRQVQKKNQGQGSRRPLLEGQGSRLLPQVQKGAGDAHQ